MESCTVEERGCDQHSLKYNTPVISSLCYVGEIGKDPYTYMFRQSPQCLKILLLGLLCFGLSDWYLVF